MQTFSQTFVRGTPLHSNVQCSRPQRRRAQAVRATVATEPRTELKTTKSENVRSDVQLHRDMLMSADVTMSQT